MKVTKKNNEAAKENLVLNLPNLISALRLGMVPLLASLALEHKAELFLTILALSLFTDALDGFLARRLDQVTKLGTQMDSWADMATYAVMLLGLYVIWPDIYQSESTYLVIAFSSWLVPLLVCFARFQKFPSYHTWAAKLAAVSLVPGYFVATLWGEVLLFRIVLLFYLWVALEQVMITSILPRWQGDIDGLWHALSIARSNGS
ncbi:MAG: CDP-alcohol phosphatidyltransferase family protein [Porticoccaceae bacterium]|nr:CDP-alcohol phosphatidyltransferase family protein [Pseudomonadales bacterium]MCP5172077.1 CDP-alcohol phosphatidyltransferase family protein [Pseudomonadales bacterium]